MYVYIEDGYTRRARISAIAGLHGQLDFEYRPMLPAEVEELEGRISTLVARGDHRAASNMVAAAIAEKLTEWDVKLRKSREAVPINSQAVARLPVGLFTKLKLVIQGGRASDPRDDWSADEWEEYRSTGGSIDLGAERKN